MSLGMIVKGGQDAGAGGSVELSVKVKAKERPADAGNAVNLAINVKAAAIHQVSFVGYYCDEEGNVIVGDDGAQQNETIEVQDVRHGGQATLPANLARSYEADGGAQAECWVDGWYAYGPDGALQKVDLADYEVTGGTTLVCYWKRGYVVRLDPNNGSDAGGGAVFDGIVGGGPEGHVAVARDVAFEEGSASGDPDGYVAPEFPEAERAGYVFKGWYWADGTGIKDSHGRAVLDEATGCVAEAGDTKGYDFFRTECADGRTPTLYAKWELGPRVRIDLEGAVTDSGTARLYCWPGRGYTLDAPAADKEVQDGFLVTSETLPAGGLDVTDALAITRNPTHALSTKVFKGWGYETTSDGTREQRELVSCERDDDDACTYWLLPLALDYLSDDIASWNDISSPEDEASAPAGSRRATWAALYDTARISVTAPFRVTFQKEAATEGGTEIRPYTADELEGKAGALPQIYSPAQPFYNRSSVGEGEESVPVSVYVSAIECVDKGAGTLFPCTTDDKRVLGLGETDAFIGGAGAQTALRFGYDAASGANHASAGADAARWLVLPPAMTDAAPSKELYFGLDLTKVQLNRNAIVMGGTPISGSAAASSYVEALANVRYTYAVAS